MVRREVDVDAIEPVAVARCRWKVYNISDASPRAEDKSYALLERISGEVERCHQVRQGIFDEHL